MSDQFLDFDINGEIIATIKRHKANTATMAREIIQIRAEYTDLANMYEADTNKLRAELAQAREALRWIPVSERMPEAKDWVSDRVEVCIRGYKDELYVSDMHCSYVPKDWNSGLSGDGWIYRAGWYPPNTGTPTKEIITHWRPLSEPPEAK